MANIRIGLSNAFSDADRVLLSDCIAKVLDEALDLPVSAVSFQFEEIARSMGKLICIEIQLFPAGSNRLRRFVCSQIIELAAEAMQIESKLITVTIASPPQERKLP